MNESSSREEQHGRKKKVKLTSFLNSINDANLMEEVYDYLESKVPQERQKNKVFLLYHDLLIIHTFYWNHFGSNKKPQSQIIEDLEKKIELKVGERIKKKLCQLKKEDIKYHLRTGQDIKFYGKTYCRHIKNESKQKEGSKQKHQQRSGQKKQSKVQKTFYKRQLKNMSGNQQTKRVVGELKNVFASNPIQFDPNIMVKVDKRVINFTTKQTQQQRNNIIKNSKEVKRRTKLKVIQIGENEDEAIEISSERGDEQENIDLFKFSGNLYSYKMFKQNPFKFKQLEWSQEEDKFLQQITSKEELDMVIKFKGHQETMERIRFLGFQNLFQKPEFENY